MQTPVGSLKKQENSRKNIYLCFIDYTKPLIVWSQLTEKFFERWEYQNALPASWETCVQVKKQQLEPDREETGSKLGKKYIKTVCCHPAYLTYMQSTSCEMLAGWSTSWNQDWQEKYQ